LSIQKVCLISLSLLLASAGCRHQKKPSAQAIDYTRELPPGQLALRKLAPGDYPDFSVMQTRLDALAQAIDNSLVYLKAPSSRQFYPYLDISHARAVATLEALKQLVARARQNQVQWAVEIPRLFEVYQSIGAPSPDNTSYTGQVLFTGYFTPIYDARLTRQGPYQYPLYKRPAALGPAGTTQPADQTQKYLTRAQILAQPSPLAGQELVWLKSRWEAYVITVQGSARLRLGDGRIYEVGYAGNNGYDYTSPGRQMLADGVISRDQLNLKGLAAYFQSHPQAMDQYLSLNQRYIFFAERPGGPFGSLNVPVTPMATIATDKSVYPRALPAWLDVPIPTSELGNPQPYRGLMLDQDTGGAIRAAGRCDIYMGVGPAAQAIAGHQLHAGRLYYLAIKPEYVPQYAPVGGE
jgi:membrane-bound lytic murein transglycosylase A